MTIQTIRPQDVFQLRQAGKPIEIIDVRTPVEYAESHADGARLVPLDQLDPSVVLSTRNGSADETLYLICKSGARAGKAAEKFHAAGFTNVRSIEGGTTTWEQAGLPMVHGTRHVISLERQVRIAAGSLVLLGTLLGFFVHRVFFIIPTFVGSGLIFAGVTDWCGMGMLLAKMPWNRRG